MNERNLKFKRMLEDPLRKNLLVLSIELLSESIRVKRFAQEYLSRFCYRKGNPSLRNFVSDRNIGILQMSRIVHSDESAKRMIDKVKFYEFCVEHDLPTPKVLCTNNGSDFSDFKSTFKIKDAEAFRDYCSEWVASSPHRSIFIKPIDGKGGHGAYRIDSNQLDDLSYLKTIFEDIVSQSMIIQETLIQHPLINAISPASINTLRVDTYIPLGERSRVMSACMRFGRSGYVVDNPASSGGFFAPVSLDGVLHAPGLQMLAVGNNTYTHHPDTGVALEGVKIPFFNEALDLVNRACELSGDRLIGWDICIGPDGPIIIEGNHNYMITLQDVAYGGYMNHPDFKRVLAEENLD